jgi:hypothetical protein
MPGLIAGEGEFKFSKTTPGKVWSDWQILSFSARMRPKLQA